MAWLLALLQTLLFIASAPLLAGWLKKVKCRLQNRRSPSLFQPYRDLRKLWRKEPIVAHSASWIFKATPYIVLSTTVLTASIVPLIAVNLPTAKIADVVVLIGFFALGRFFLALAGMDIGTAFGGGVISVIAYAIVTWAMVRSPMGMVSALRETSTLFAAGIGMIFLKERFSYRKLVCCSAFAAGAILIGLG